MDMKALEEMFASMLDPLMKRLEEVEKLAAEARDDDRKEEKAGEAEKEEMEEKSEMEEPGKEVLEEAIEEAKEKEEGESEMMYKSRYEEAMERLAKMEKDSVMAEAETAKLREEIELRDAKDVVNADIATKPHLSQMSEKLVGIYRKDRDLYAEVLNVAGDAKADTKSILSQRVTSGFSEVQAPKDPFSAAHDVAASEGITYRQALEGLLNA